MAVLIRQSSGLWDGSHNTLWKKDLGEQSGVIVISQLKKLEALFLKGHLKKEEYIKKMYIIHNILWSYQEFIENKNIESIEISRSRVKFTTRTGIEMVCDPSDERSTPLVILDFGDYEKYELQMMRKFIKKNSLILDIGANLGWYCLNLSKNIPKGLIMAFEPIPKTFEYLKKNIQLNNINNVKLYNFGLLDKKATLEFCYFPKISGAASLKALYKDRNKQKIKCKVRRLDDFIFGMSRRVDFIKCDVEGAEIFVIRGALKTLKKMKPVLFLEMLRKWSAKFGYHPNEIITLLSNIGYDCFYVRKDKLVRIRAMDEQTVATNYFFLHRDKHKKYIRRLS